MAYATVAQLREYLPSLPTANGSPNATAAAVAAKDATLTSVLDRATAMIDEHNGFSFAAYPGTATAKTIITSRTEYLFLPPHQTGSITTVVDNGTTVAATAYTIHTSDDGRREYLVLTGTEYSRAVWSGRHAVVTAKWGYGPAPTAVVEACLELAVNIWRGSTKGMFTDIIGVEGQGSVVYSGFMTRAIRDVLAACKTSFTQVVV